MTKITCVRCGAYINEQNEADAVRMAEQTGRIIRQYKNEVRWICDNCLHPYCRMQPTNDDKETNSHFGCKQFFRRLIDAIETKYNTHKKIIEINLRFDQDHRKRPSFDEIDAYYEKEYRKAKSDIERRLLLKEKDRVYRGEEDPSWIRYQNTD